jgi:hypothetical protein
MILKIILMIQPLISMEDPTDNLMDTLVILEKVMLDDPRDSNDDPAG